MKPFRRLIEKSGRRRFSLLWGENYEHLPVWHRLWLPSLLPWPSCRKRRFPLTRRLSYAPDKAIDEIRRKVSMELQKPNPFPKSIFDNVPYGLKVNRIGTTAATS